MDNPINELTDDELRQLRDEITGELASRREKSKFFHPGDAVTVSLPGLGGEFRAAMKKVKAKTAEVVLVQCGTRVILPWRDVEPTEKAGKK